MTQVYYNYEETRLDDNEFFTKKYQSENKGQQSMSWIYSIKEAVI